MRGEGGGKQGNEVKDKTTVLGHRDIKWDNERENVISSCLLNRDPNFSVRAPKMWKTAL